jgi:hypothetical protein
MTQDISGFGAVATIRASTTFPQGLTITQFADDADSLDMSAVTIGDTAMGLNGDLIGWSRPVPLPLVLNVIPASDDDTNLQILFDNNRVGKGKVSAYDKITAVIVYPDGSVITLIGGRCVNYNYGKGISSGGRIKTKTYSFSFESKV